MSHRADLLAAVAAAPPLTEPWVQAVRALGRWRQAQHERPAPRRLGRATGKSYYQTIYAITCSHHFTEAERLHYRQTAQWEHGSEVLYREVTGLAARRAQAERQAKKQAATTT